MEVKIHEAMNEQAAAARGGAVHVPGVSRMDRLSPLGLGLRARKSSRKPAVESQEADNQLQEF